tara:strand:- start:1670 stop:2539 length:870 start_codon:yes stop_codon:yes gene_type:complete
MRRFSRKPMSLFHSFVIGAALLLSSCETIDVGNMSIDTQKLINIGSNLTKSFSQSESEELAIGREAAAILLGAAPLSTRNQQQQYINKLGRYLASHSKRPGLPWRFGIINHPAINAYAAPGGYIFVTQGLLNVLENEAQLAAVLAHEITHVVEKHHLKEIQKSGGFSALVDTGVLLYESSDSPQLAPKYVEKVANGAKSVFTSGLSKGAEYHADNEAIFILQKAGYDPFALFDVLQKLDERGSQDGMLSLMLATHPTPRQRLDKLDSAATSLGSASGKSLEMRFNSALR